MHVAQSAVGGEEQLVSRHVIEALAYTLGDVVRRLAEGFGYDVVTSTPDELSAFGRAEIDRWRSAVAAAKLEPRN